MKIEILHTTKLLKYLSSIDPDEIGQIRIKNLPIFNQPSIFLYCAVPSFTVGEKQKRSKYAENTGKKSVHFIQKKYIYQRMMSPIVPKVGISEMDKALMMDEKSSLD